MKMEYVMSGLSLCRLATSNFRRFDGNIITAKKIFSDYLHSKHHVSGLLFNAMTEANFIPEFLHEYVDVVHSIHSDSGGLQIAQKGLELDKKLKEKIYKCQVLNSDVAMSFDSMPMKVLEGATNPRSNMGAKKFLINEARRSGTESGQNIKEQIEIFLKYYDESPKKCKPLIILHGNHLTDFQTYFESILNEIPNEYYQYVGGIAIAGSCIGIGVLEAIDSIYAYKSLNIPKEFGNRLHFLGYGSISRLIPIVISKNSGLLDNIQISYDSTSHVSRFFNGAVNAPGNITKKIGVVPSNRDARMIFGTLYDEFLEYLPVEVSKDEWIFHTTKDLRTSERFKGDDISARCNTVIPFLATAYSIKNFINYLDEIIDNVDVALCSKKFKKYSILRHLSDCDTADKWFNDYRPKLKKYIHTDRIERISSEHQTIENFLR